MLNSDASINTKISWQNTKVKLHQQVLAKTLTCKVTVTEFKTIQTVEYMMTSRIYAVHIVCQSTIKNKLHIPICKRITQKIVFETQCICLYAKELLKK